MTILAGVLVAATFHLASAQRFSMALGGPMHAAVTTATASLWTKTSVPASAKASHHPTSSVSYKASTISCPACDGAAVTDAEGGTYRVYCDYQLFSDHVYNVQMWTTPAGCLLECDNHAGCNGSTFFPQGNCELANGSNVFPTQQPGYTAFLPVPKASKTPSTSPSRYPTGTRTPSHSLTLGVPITTLYGPRSTPATGCNKAAATCPACNDTDVADIWNQTYRVQCNFDANCDTIYVHMNSTQEACLQYCDEDPICLAAIYPQRSQAGNCTLCQGFLKGSVDSSISNTDVLFLAKPAWNISELASTATTFHTSHTSVLQGHPTIVSPRPHSSSTSNPSHSTSAIVQTIRGHAISDVSCPAYNDVSAVDASNGRDYEIQCDMVYAAATTRWTSARNFADCGILCTADCNGFEYGPTSSCALLTAISVAIPSASWTAAARITYPPVMTSTTSASAVASVATSFIGASAPSRTLAVSRPTPSSRVITGGVTSSAPKPFVSVSADGSLSLASPGVQTNAFVHVEG